MATEKTLVTPMRVLISGGGIAGPALALLLIRQGHTCSIIERSPNLRANGQQIDVRKEGIEAMKRMDIYEKVKAKVVDEFGTQFVSYDGKQIALFPKVVDTKGRQGFTSEFEIMRGDLCRILHEEIQEKVEYRFGLTVTEYKDEPDHVSVTLSDGSVEKYDMLVAADGQSSHIRGMMLKDESKEVDKSRDLGIYVCYYTVPRIPGDSNYATMCLSDKRRISVTRFHTDKLGQVYLGTMGPADEMNAALKEGVDKQKELYAKIFKNSSWQADRLIQDMHDSEDFYAQAMIQIKAGIWSKGRVVLLGDAGYGPTPLTGMGTSLALIGATILAGEISKNNGDLAAAFAAYDRVLRPYVETVQQIPKGMIGVVYRNKTWGVKAVNALISLITKLRLDKALQFAVLSADDPFRIPDYSSDATIAAADAAVAGAADSSLKP